MIIIHLLFASFLRALYLCVGFLPTLYKCGGQRPTVMVLFSVCFFAGKKDKSTGFYTSVKFEGVTPGSGSLRSVVFGGHFTSRAVADCQAGCLGFFERGKYTTARCRGHYGFTWRVECGLAVSEQAYIYICLCYCCCCRVSSCFF
jgi:hypothetical protein